MRELRDAFGVSASIPQRMKQFRAERIASLVADEAPAWLVSRTLMVLHVMPQSAFDTPQSVDLSYVLKNEAFIWPMRATGLSRKINFDGVLSFFPGIHLLGAGKQSRLVAGVNRGRGLLHRFI